MIKFWICHYTKLKERMSHLEKLLNSANISSYEIIKEYDADILTRQDLSKFDFDNMKNIVKQNKKINVCSLFLKHMLVMNKISNSTFDSNILLEDDVIFKKDFVHQCQKIIDEVKGDYDMIFLGGSFDIPKHMLKSDQLTYLKGHEPTKWGGAGATRTTDGIIISKECATKILQYYVNRGERSILYPVDHWYNMVIRELDLKVYWCQPRIVTQGSKNGTFVSYLNS